jgi:transcriptional regulator with XRE-family HTH domain
MSPPDGRRIRREFAERVRRTMEARALTPATLAERAMLDRPTVDAILAARHPVWVDEIYLLAGALDVTPAELIDEEAGYGGEDR